MLRLELVRETDEKIKIIKEKMLMAQSRFKSYADKHRKGLDFDVGDHAFLKVSLIRGVVRLGQKRGKLSPRFIGPFKILYRVGKVSYKLALPPKMSGVVCTQNMHFGIL